MLHRPVGVGEGGGGGERRQGERRQEWGVWREEKVGRWRDGEGGSE